MTKILINSYNKNSGNYQDFTIQLNTPIAINQKSTLKLEYFKMINGIYNFDGSNVFYIQEQELDTSTQATTNKYYNVAIPAGSYTASDFASTAQTAITNASASSGYGWTYSVTFDATSSTMTYNMTTTAPSGYIYTAYINTLTNQQVYLTGISIYFPNINVNIMPITVTPNMSNYNLLITVNKNTFDHVSTNIKKFSFIVPFNTSDSIIVYTPNNSFDNSITVFEQAFNNITISMTCLEFDPVINNECSMLLELV